MEEIEKTDAAPIQEPVVQPDADTVTEVTQDAAADVIIEEQSTATGQPTDLQPAAQANAQAAAVESLSDKVRIISPFKLVIKRFFRSKLSVIGLSVFLAVLLFSFIGPLFVGWGETEVDRTPQPVTYSYVSKVARDPDGNEFKYYIEVPNQFTEQNSHAALGSYGYNSQGEKALHLLGTDKDGRDIFVRLMYGGRLSLLLSFMVVLIYTVLGIIMGGLAGYFGGWVDMVIMRIVDILNCIPSLPILLIFGAIYNGMESTIGAPQSLRIYFMMGILTLLSWPGIARLVRGQILFLREQEYMIAADALGFGVGRKIFKHLVPNVLPQLIVSMTLGLGGTILTEASLSFLGLGVPMQYASLGQMVSAATKNDTVMSVYIADWLPAGLIIILAVVAFNFIGDGLRDALDPKMKR